MISIIIPTLNEEDYLPKLLESIKGQDYKDHEIIVADAASTDKTVEIAKRYGCRVVGGGMPAKGRNEGAKVAKSNILLFLDADIVLPNAQFLSSSLKEFQGRSLTIASFFLIPLSSNTFARLFMNLFYNKRIVLLENILPYAAVGILVKKDLFDELKGFDESIKLAEDVDLARRASKIRRSKFGIIRSTYIVVSDRRFRRDGWITTGLKYFLCDLHLIFFGPVKSDIFKYRFGNYAQSSNLETKEMNSKKRE